MISIARVFGAPVAAADVQRAWMAEGGGRNGLGAWLTRGQSKKQNNCMWGPPMSIAEECAPHTNVAVSSVPVAVVVLAGIVAADVSLAVSTALGRARAGQALDADQYGARGLSTHLACGEVDGRNGPAVREPGDGAHLDGTESSQAIGPAPGHGFRKSV